MTRTFLLLLCLFTLPATAQEAKPATLKILADANAPEKATVGLGQMDKLISDVLGPDAAAKEKARGALVMTGVLSAVVVRMRLKKSTDDAEKQQLGALSEACRRDSESNAKLLFNLAIMLSTISAENKHWKHPKKHAFRLAAKLIHIHYCKAKPYTDELARSLGMTTPYKDLPASADLFGLAGTMYERLAAGAKGQAATKFRESAKRCHAAAATRRKVATKTR